MTERYIEMGFSEDVAEEAISRFGDDLHAGCHWLMMRETMGRVPKRLKRDRDVPGNTYSGSTVRYNGLNWRIMDFDEQHALIRMCPCNEHGPCSRWEHISDARIEWIQVRHHEPSGSAPKASWTRTIGELTMSLAWMDPDRLVKADLSSILDLYIKHGRPLDHNHEWTKWRCVTTLSREFVHEPARPRPKGVSSDDIHSFRIEWMSYFHALCDVYNVPQDTFSDTLYNSSSKKVVELFPESIREDLSLKLKRWQRPQPYLSRLNRRWRRDCLPLFQFVPTKICQKEFELTCSIQIHNMTFVQPARPDAGIHLQLQRLFFMVYPEIRPQKHVDGPMDSAFLEKILHESRKTWNNTRSPGASFEATLLPYQKRCLDWLVARETLCGDTVQESTSSWGWVRHELDDGFVFHTSVFGHISLTPPNASIRGGILAQDVGMGKTVEMLALISTNNAPGPTLVVVPTTMLSVWQSEAKQRTPSLKVVKFHGARRTKNMDELRGADIVLTTYRIVVNETQQHVPTIGAVRWGRIILDESHELRHIHTETTKAICRLFAPYRWCVSATPWPKGMVHASAILSFLGVKPFDEAPSLGNFSAAQLLLRQHHGTNPSLMSKLFQSLTWWQRKRHVSLSLPPVREQSLIVPCEHPDLYARLLEVIRFRIQVDEMTSRRQQTRMLHYARWLRQMATHVGLNNIAHFAMPSSTNEVASEFNSVDSFIQGLGTTNYEQSLRDIIDSWRQGNETCSICMDAMDRPTLTPCNHMFCFDCIQASYQHDSSRRCPLCRASVGVEPLRELTENAVPENTGPTFWRSHDTRGYPVEMEMTLYNKIQEVSKKMGNKFEQLVNMIAGNSEKYIVFTQFHDAWSKVCESLTKSGINYVSIEGRMTPKRRQSAIEKFQEVSTTRVFVMTTRTASVGVTLTAASHIVFLEPCQNKHMKKQAIGRAWRIGQTKPVTVTTLRTQGTIDMFEPKDFQQHITGPAPSADE
ncbi:DEAD/DEAH box helicase [bacterium]|nr:DEAD/DEAH box helicase [bacterium]